MICSSAWHGNYVASGAPSKAHRDPVTVVMEQYVEAESRLPLNRFSLVSNISIHISATEEYHCFLHITNVVLQVAP
jgi:hypothetical protein